MDRIASEGADTGSTASAPAYAAAVSRLLAVHGDTRDALLPLLHALQAEFGFIDDAMIPPLAAALNLSRADVHGVVTFYHDFRRAPAGRHLVKLCRAESCQARGSAATERDMLAALGVGLGETTADGGVTVDAVYCLGLCAIGPNALVDGIPVARLDADRVARIVREVTA